MRYGANPRAHNLISVNIFFPRAIWAKILKVIQKFFIL